VLEFQEHFLLPLSADLAPLERIEKLCKERLAELQSRRPPPTEKEKRDAERKRVVEEVRLQSLEKLAERK
jgi:hypothetical protein